MASIVRTPDWESWVTVVAELPETTVYDIAEQQTGSRTYLAGTITVDPDTMAAYDADALTGPGDKFLVTDEGVYVRIWSTVTADCLLVVDQSWATTHHLDGEEPVPVRVVEPSPPTTPTSWFYDELDRAYADLTS